MLSRLRIGGTLVAAGLLAIAIGAILAFGSAAMVAGVRRSR